MYKAASPPPNENPSRSIGSFRPTASTNHRVVTQTLGPKDVGRSPWCGLRVRHGEELHHQHSVSLKALHDRPTPDGRRAIGVAPGKTSSVGLSGRPGLSR